MARTEKSDLPAVQNVLLQLFSQPKSQPFDFEGEAGSVLLVHGFPGTPADMRPLGEELHAAGWAARGILLPGFGTDIGTLRQRRAEEWIEAAVGNLRDLKKRGKPVVLIGHSMGGATALNAAAQEPPDRLVLLAPFWKINHLTWRLLPAIKHVVRTFQPLKMVEIELNDPQTRAAIAEAMPDVEVTDEYLRATLRDLRLPTAMMDQVRRVGQKGAQCAPRLTMPILIIQGEQDTLVVPENTRALAARFPSPPKYVAVEGQHNIEERDQPAWETVRREVLAFVSEQAAVSVQQL